MLLQEVMVTIIWTLQFSPSNPRKGARNTTKGDILEGEYRRRNRRTRGVVEMKTTPMTRIRAKDTGQGRAQEVGVGIVT